jgi:hypothetical protein
MSEQSYNNEFTVDRVDGSYAVGKAPYSVIYVGPKDGAGAVGFVHQANGVTENCSKLKAAKFPPELVDGKCYDAKADQVPYSL